jgi:hypothetical protein
MAQIKDFQQGADGDGLTVSTLNVTTATISSVLTTASATITTATITNVQVADGTALLPSITNTGDTNTGVFFPAADTIGISAGGAEAARIDSSGNVGIGTQSSAGDTLRYLDVQNANTGSNSGAIIRLITNNVANSSVITADIVKYKNGQFAINNNETGSEGFTSFTVGASERMRITSTGGVGIGTSNEPLQADLDIGTLTTSEVTKSIRLGYIGSFNGWRIANTNTASSTNAGLLQFQRGTGAAFSNAMTLNDSGNVGVGISPETKFHVDGTIRYTNRPATGTITAIGFDANGDLKASSSSLRYKHDVEDYDKGLAELMQLRSVSFKFNGEENTNIGFIAEEVDALGLAEVMLYNENAEPEGVIYSNMVALLTKAIQELNAKVDELQAEVNSLK